MAQDPLLSNLPEDLPAEYHLPVIDFIETCKAFGWDTREGAWGKCWIIATWFAWLAQTSGIPAKSITIQCVRNAHPAAADELHINFVVIDGWEFYFGGRGRLEDPRPWPLIGRLDDLMAEFGSTLLTNFCHGCGFRNHGHRGQHEPGETCPGHLHPYALRNWALDRVERRNNYRRIKSTYESLTDSPRRPKFLRNVELALNEIEHSRARIWLAICPDSGQVVDPGPMGQKLKPGETVALKTGTGVTYVDIPNDLRTPAAPSSGGFF